MTTPDTTMLAHVQSIVAAQLGLKVVDVDAELTFADVGADDLDLVEITMEVEERFGIMIHEHALLSAAGIQGSDALCDYLTIREFATVAAAAPKQTQEGSLRVADDEILGESQVGSYGDLSKLSNPNGLVLVFIPSFEELIQFQEQRLARELDNAEIEALRQKAVVIALPQKMAEKLKQHTSERDANK